MNWIRVALLCLPIVLLDSVPKAEPIQSGLVEVIDGDTIKAHGKIIRLVGLDAPEDKSHAERHPGIMVGCSTLR
jgi:endonuclease YncB( thermonuclease family)